MPANGEIASSSWVDSTAGIMVPYFATGQAGASGKSFQGGPHWIATVSTIRAGKLPGTATIHIPLKNAQDENAPTIALVTGSPLDSIKAGTRVGVLGFAAAASGTDDPGTATFVGVVVDVTHEKGSDSAIVEVLDDKYLLEGVQIIGQFHIEGTTGGAKYRQGWACWMNPGGEPNCTLSNVSIGEQVYMPVFCPKNYGLSDGEAVPGVNDTNVQSGLKATYWTPALALTYLRCIFSDAVSDLVEQFPYYFTFPSHIQWPEAWGSALEDGNAESPTAAQNSAQAIGERKGREMVLEGISLLAAINEVLKQAGPYALLVSPQMTGTGNSMDFASQIQIVCTKYTGEGITLDNITTGPAAQNMVDANVVTEASYTESGRNTYTRVSGSGGLVLFERRVACVRSPSGGRSNVGTYGLKTAADATLLDQLEAEFQTALRAYTYGSTPQANIDAILRKRAYEKVGQAYRLAEDFDYQAGISDEEDFPICQVGRPIAPHQLSSFLEGSEALSYSKYRAYAPIYVEYSANSTTDSDGTWTLLQQNDGLARDADGTIWIRGIRTKGKGYDYTVTGAHPNEVVEFSLNAIRMNVAIPADHRIDQAYKMPQDPGTGEDFPVYDDGDGGGARIDESLVRMYYADARDLYQLHYRAASSYPDPATAGGTAPGASTLRSDQTYLQRALKRRLRELGRVHRTGRLIMPHLNFALTPGTSIKELANTGGGTFPIRGVILEVSYHADRDGQQFTEVYFE